MKIGYKDDTLTIQWEDIGKWTRQRLEEDLQWYKDSLKKNNINNNSVWLSIIRGQIHSIEKKLEDYESRLQ